MSTRWSDLQDQWSELDALLLQMERISEPNERAVATRRLFVRRAGPRWWHSSARSQVHRARNQRQNSDGS